MATNYNITMKQFNGTDYDNLYPAANLSNSIGSITASQISGKIPASQISGLSTTPNVSNATGTLAVSHGGTGRTTLTSGYYLVGNGTGTVTLQSPSQLQSSLGLDDYAKIQTGSYTGTGTYGSSNPNSLTFDFPMQIFFMQGDAMSTNGFFIINNPVYSSTYVTLTFTSSRAQFSKTYLDFSFSGNMIQWYYNDPYGSYIGVNISNSEVEFFIASLPEAQQFNESYKNYYWTTIG